MLALKRNIDIILILIIGFVLRFSVSITHSYTNDELSAINRLSYDNFSDFIEKGVKTGDMHPAGVQVFEKLWSSIFGTSEMALRFPFVLCGVASIFLIFLIGMKWFNRRTGIYAAAILSVLYFPIIQSELARPYSPGLLITLLTAWFYHKVLFCEVKKFKNAILLGLCFAAGMYTHYFLFLFLVFIGFTGLFFLKKDNFKLYFLAVAIAVLLFIPHISITLFHLRVGGLGWLAPPEHDFIIDFIFYAFNESWIFLVFILLLILFSFFQKSDEQFKSKYYFLIGIWFFGIYIVGFIISYISTPVLKIPVMLFAFPFFILMVAYLISKIRHEKIVLFLILSIGFVSTYFEQDLYGNKHMGYKSIAQHMVDWNKKYGEENIYTVYNLSDPNYMNFYANQLGDTINFDWDVIEFSDDVLIRRDLMNRTEEYCVVGYSERLTLPQVFETVKAFYPTMIEEHHFDNSAVFLMSSENDLMRKSECFYSALSVIDTINGGWIMGKGFVVPSGMVHSPFLMNDTIIYGPDFLFKKGDVKMFDRQYMKVVVRAVCPNDGQLTVAISGMRNGKQIIQPNGEVFWMGHDLEEMLIETADPIQGLGSSFFAFEIPDFIKETDELKISLWNRNGKEISIGSFEIYVLENNWN